MSPIILALLAFSAASLVYIVLFVGHREKHLPPGPPTVPILGNILQIPKKGAHFKFTKWARQYGPIYSIKLGTGTAVVITDRRLVKELVDKKGLKYSERPKSYVGKLIGGGDHVLLMDYGPQLRDTRKLVHSSFAEKLVEENCIPLQEAEARQMIRDYLLDPQDHMLHPKRFSNSTIMSLIWGVRTPTPHIKHMKRMYSTMDIWTKVMETGATPPVDIYPLLHWLPQSVFSNWVDRAMHVQKEMNSLYSDFLRDIRKRRSMTGSRKSFMDNVLDQADSGKRLEGLTYSDHELWFLGGALIEAGSDTTASMITAFVQAMAAYPEVQRKAQAEIDSVLGADRSPTWQDYERLPYVAQCVKETMRWRPVTPLGFPHALAEDDWVDGMLLPKGTVVIVNIWGIHNDPNHVENPEVYDPDHFKDITALAPELAKGSWEKRDHYGYGAGRRICPGAHLAERSMFLAMSKLLWAFDIRPGDGGPPDTDPRTGYSEGFAIFAYDFEARFEVRGDERRQTILREFENSKGDFKPYELTAEETD